MREAHAAMAGSGRPSSVEALTGAATCLHGPSPVEEKLAWSAHAVRTVTEAAAAAYVALRADSEVSSVAAGAATYDVDTFARPVVAKTLARALGPGPLNVGDLQHDRGWRRFLDRLDLPMSSGALAVAVPSEDAGAHGVLMACHPDPDHFDLEDEAAVCALAAHLGVALDNERRLSRLTELHEVQRQVVHRLHEAVRPPTPTVEAAELGVYHLPADPSAPTGGDLHDWLVLPDGDVFMAVVDVMGKGVGATKDALAVTHALRLLVLDECPLEHLVARADELLTAHNPDLVATVVVGIYHPADGRLRLAGGGHPPALLVYGKGDVALVPVPGVAVGWPGAGSSEVVELTLERNDTIVLYTDGLIESTKDVLAGLANLTRAAAEIARYPSTHVARALVERSLSGAMRRDDSLALALRRRTPPSTEASAPLAPFEYRFSPNAATIPIGRHLLADWLAHLVLEDAERDDLLLVASELCANAVRHSSGAPRAVALRAWADTDSVVVEVEDDGAGFQPESRFDEELPDTEAERGRGLYVVDALSDELSVRREDGRTLVRAVRHAVLPASMR